MIYYCAQFTGPLKLIQKYINCQDVQKLFHSTTMYFVNNWFIVSFNWHFLNFTLIAVLAHHNAAPPHCGGCLASWKVSVAQPVWHNSLRYIELQVNNKHLCSQGVLVFKRITSVTSVYQGNLWFSYNFHMDIIYLSI